MSKCQLFRRKITKIIRSENHEKILTILIGSLFWGGLFYTHHGQAVQNPIDVFEKLHQNKVLSLQRKTRLDRTYRQLG
ncbi:hypothetical protein LEP1GSC062_0332 [Leptospira alexanderi serovar Manhao 3 str. L 60]|uniref:Uncharacterized protein n=1 Tax=Leptospira alexanderi serovar Manhao 3 str. L 60 TaxID=1049759 RepID=V6HS83_9LEPT|nr:hypothetical protein LEP1GSC062_0332 [Leptospira alexanderi serovar Manhao 3 str. L 60]